jgi:hypothetical protein
MATGFATAPSPIRPDLTYQKMRASNIVNAGASWFLWIAGLSIVNSIIGMAGGGVHFIVGLGVTQVVDVLARRAGSSGMVLDLVINGFVAGIFVIFWNFAKKGQSWAFIVGMLLYALDGLLLLSFKDIFSVAFHAYALFRIYQGMKAVSAMQQAEAASLPVGAPIVPR